MNTLFCMIAIISAFLGMLIRIGKGDRLMVGFVKDLKNKKHTYNMDLLRAFVAKILYLSAGCFAVMALGELLAVKMITWGGIVLFFGLVVYSSKYTEDKSKFKKEGWD